jgi:hypothetical protein
MSSKPASVLKSEPAKMPRVTTEKATIADTTASAAITEHEELIQSIGTIIQDLFHSSNAKAKTALDALNQDLMNDDTKCESLVTAGGCFVLVQLLKNCLDKLTANGRIEYVRVTEISSYPEVVTLGKTLNVICNLTREHVQSRVGITALGGVEALVKIMQTLPKCQALQEGACYALHNLTCCSIGKAKAIKSGGIEVLLDAVTTHLDSVCLCQQAFWALLSIASDSKENTRLLIILGGGAAVAKVSIKWRDDGNVQTKLWPLMSRREGNEGLGRWGGREKYLPYL